MDLSHWARGLALALLAAAGVVHAAEGIDAKAVEAYFGRPFLRELAISPSGRYLAAAVPTEGGRVQLAVMGLAPLGPPKAIAGVHGADIQSIRWVNDERIVFTTFDLARAAGNQDRAPGLYAVNRDGSDIRQLIRQTSDVVTEARGAISRLLNWDWRLVNTLDDGSPEIVVGHSHYDPAGFETAVSLYRLNTVTAEKRLLTAGAPEGTRQWLLDAEGVPRVGVAYTDDRRRVYWRRKDATAWEQIGDFPRYLSQGFRPTYIDRDGVLYAIATNRATGTDALYRFDAMTGKPEAEPFLSLNRFDLEPTLETDRGRLVGVHFNAEQESSYWLDTRLKAVQASIDQALPGRANRLYCGHCSTSQTFVVESSSDREPGEFFLLDLQGKSMKRIGAQHPAIDERRQARRSFHWFDARDKLQVPVVVTRPADARDDKPLPTVVLVHGGPWVRGAKLRWSADAQFLASRGYLVLEPDFRGSDGYGARHFNASFKQWGLAMQDDLQDALRWAAAKGWADPARTCIVGGSYGGYAALMGTVKHPESYRCAVSIAGVTDIHLMYSISWSDFSDGWKRYGMPELIGDPVKDAEQLRATSPLHQAHRIKTPLLLVHGVSDLRVPVEHERKFRAAVKAAGNEPEYVEYPEEGHGGWLPKNEIDFWLRIDRFLARHIGGGAAKP